MPTTFGRELLGRRAPAGRRWHPEGGAEGRLTRVGRVGAVLAAGGELLPGGDGVLAHLLRRPLFDVGGLRVPLPLRDGLRAHSAFPAVESLLLLHLGDVPGAPGHGPRASGAWVAVVWL